MSWQDSQARCMTRPRHARQACTRGWDACTTELLDFVLRMSPSCRDMVPRHTRWFGSQQRLSLSRQRFLASVVTRFEAGT